MVFPLPCDMDSNLAAGGDVNSKLLAGGDMDTELAPDEVVVVMGCMLLLYVGMFRCILWCSSAVGLTKWMYTMEQGIEGFFPSLWKALRSVFSVEGFFINLWKAFRSVFSRHQQHSPLIDVDSPILSPTKGCRKCCWTREELQVVWDEFYDRMGKEELENLENYMEY
jgi:hypothetical protein